MLPRPSATPGTNTAYARLVCNTKLPTSTRAGRHARSPHASDHASTRNSRNGSSTVLACQGSTSTALPSDQHSAAVTAMAARAVTGPPRRQATAKMPSTRGAVHQRGPDDDAHRAGHQRRRHRQHPVQQRPGMVDVEPEAPRRRRPHPERRRVTARSPAEHVAGPNGEQGGVADGHPAFAPGADSRHHDRKQGHQQREPGKPPRCRCSQAVTRRVAATGSWSSGYVHAPSLPTGP